jgi:hypothetical protein
MTKEEPTVLNPPIHDLLTTITPMLADTSDIKLETLSGTHLFDTKGHFLPGKAT